MSYVDPAFYYNAGCGRCGSGNHLTDTDVHPDYERPVALCRGCLADLARKAGHLVGEDSVAVLAETERALQIALVRADEAEHTLAAIKQSVQRIEARAKVKADA
jgi:hypothetical protein